ncbi:hypothetical protein BU15DRAFT_68936, partial [Melanogaster broomeanus]
MAELAVPGRWQNLWDSGWQNLADYRSRKFKLILHNCTSAHPKRGRGRPKGSKNKPTAGKVGRPRKDGEPPRKRDKRNNTGSEDTGSSITRAPVRVHQESSPAPVDVDLNPGKHGTVLVAPGHAVLQPQTRENTPCRSAASRSPRPSNPPVDGAGSELSLQQSSPSTEGSGSPEQAIDPLIPPIAHLSTTVNDMACISHGTSTTSTPTHGATSPLIQRCSTEPTPRQTRRL